MNEYHIQDEEWKVLWALSRRASLVQGSGKVPQSLRGTGKRDAGHCFLAARLYLREGE